MMRAYLNIGQSTNIAKKTDLSCVMFARALLLLNVIARRGRLASLALVAIFAFANCETQEPEPEFCFTVTGQARESDQEAVMQLWGQGDCSPDLELEAAASLLKAARVERMKNIGVLSYDGETPSGTDTRFGSNLGSDTQICVSAERVDTICSQKRPPAQKIIVPVPIPEPDAGRADTEVPDAAVIQQIAEARVELRGEISQSQSLIGHLRQTRDSSMLSYARRLQDSMNTAQGVLDSEEATLEQLRQQQESLGRTKRSASAALRRFRGAW